MLQFRFDRYLLPATTVRQAIRLFSGSEELSFFSQPEYDLVERVLVYRPLGPLPPKLTITVELIIPEEQDSDGLRAFDGAPLAEGPVPLRFDFHTNGLEPAPVAIPEEPAPSCAQLIQDVFSSTGGCGSSSCHVRNDTPLPTSTCPPGYGADGANQCVPVPRMGLLLADAAGLRLTAINKVAHQTEVGSKGGTPLEDPVRLGVQMPIIDPSRPDNSYLMYKLLRRYDNFDGDDSVSGVNGICETRYQVGFLPGGPCLPPTEAESTRLREWFVRGEPMPPMEQNTVSRADLRDIQAWIRAGAQCP